MSDFLWGMMFSDLVRSRCGGVTVLVLGFSVLIGLVAGVVSAKIGFPDWSAYAAIGMFCGCAISLLTVIFRGNRART